MTLADFDSAGAVVPPLTDDEALACVGCCTIIPAAAVDADVGQTVRESGEPTCFGCESRAGFERTNLGNDRRSVAQRWGDEVAAGGWTPIPSLLFAHAADLGLKPTDLAVIAALEDYRRSGLGESVYPSRDTLASNIGGSLWTLDASLVRLESAGLIEIGTRHRRDGSQTSNVYGRDGLSRALTLLAGSCAAGRDQAVPLGGLLGELRREGERRRAARLEAGHLESKDREAENSIKENQQDSSLRAAVDLSHGSRNPESQEGRFA